MIYLYLKTHNHTGLKYLGKTSQNPFEYTGSGKYWLSHIKKHGNNVTTTILKECTSNSEVKQWGLHYSELWDVTNSSEFANLKPENGDGGSGPCSDKTKEKIRAARKLQIITPESRQKAGKTLKEKWTKEPHFNIGRKQSEEERAHRRVINSGENNPMYGKQHSESAKEKMRGKRKKQVPVTCPHCGKTGGPSGIKRYHFDNCKFR